MVDRKDLYPGAVVTVRARVHNVGESRATLKAFDSEHGGTRYEDILSVESRPLKVGDRVRHHSWIGQIAFIHNGEATVVWEKCDPPGRIGKLSVPFDLDDLTRIPDDDTAEERTP